MMDLSFLLPLAVYGGSGHLLILHSCEDDPTKIAIFRGFSKRKG